MTVDPKTSSPETDPALTGQNAEAKQSPADSSADGGAINSRPTDSATQAVQDANGEASVEDQLRAEATRLKDQLLRLAADFDNFRKRSRRELADAERMAREDLLRDLLPVFDNLERASQHAGSLTEVQALVDGISMVNRQFADTLTKIGVERVPTVGVAFDPTMHEAVQQIETTDQSPGAVYAEILAGYRFGERLIRPAMVVVAKAPASA